MQSDIQNIKSFVTDGSERSVQDIVSKLKFISRIKEGEKVDIQTLRVMNADSWGTSIYRTLVSRGESRETTLEFIRGVVGDAFDLASKYLSTSTPFFRQIGEMIVQSLRESKVGLGNLMKTYREDRMYTSRVDTLIKTIDTKTSDLPKYTGLKEKNDSSDI